MVTRKDFEALAKAVSKLDLPPNSHAGVVAMLCVWSRSTNPRFDAARFTEACSEGCEKSIREGGAACDDCGCTDYRREGSGLVCRQCGCCYDDVPCPECHQPIQEEGGCDCDGRR